MLLQLLIYLTFMGVCVCVCVCVCVKSVYVLQYNMLTISVTVGRVCGGRWRECRVDMRLLVGGGRLFGDGYRVSGRGKGRGG